MGCRDSGALLVPEWRKVIWFKSFKTHLTRDLLFFQVSVFSEYPLCSDVVRSTEKLNYLIHLHWQIARIWRENLHRLQEQDFTWHTPSCVSGTPSITPFGLAFFIGVNAFFSFESTVSFSGFSVIMKLQSHSSVWRSRRKLKRIIWYKKKSCLKSTLGAS